MNKVHIIAFLLALCMCIPLLGSCSENRISSLDEIDYSAYPTAVAEVDVLNDVDMAGLRAMYDTLSTLLSACEAKGLKCPYEKSAVTTISLQIGYLQRDIDAQSHPKIAASRIRSLNTLYKTTLDALLSYQYGITEPKQVDMFDAATVRVEGDNLVAKYEDGSEDAVYLVGYGHWVSTLGDDVDLFDEMAYHVVQVEIGPWSVIVPRGEGSHEGLREDDPFDIDLTQITDTYIPFLERAVQENFSVCLLLSPHYFPKFMYGLYEDIGEGITGGPGYHVMHPMAQRVIEVFLDTIIPMVCEQPSVSSFCLTNEPSYNANTDDYDRPAWQEYLEETYGTIDALNTAAGCDYADFASVPLQVSRADGGLFYVYTQFNKKLFSGWHGWMAEIIAKYTAKPVHAKISAFAAWIFNYGCDEEMYEPFCGIMGCDAFSFITDERYSKQMWYSYLSTIADKPIFNSEDHVIHEEPGEFDEVAMQGHIYFEMWTGAVNGRSASTMWTWHWLGTDEEYGGYGNATDKPLSMDAASRAALDLQRLRREVAALNDADARVYVLYSEPTLLYDESLDSYEQVLFAYKSAITLGEKVGLVTEGTLDKLNEGDVLIVPGCTYVRDTAAAQILELAEAGTVKLVLFNQCMEKNEYGMARDAGTLERLYEAAQIYRYEASGSGVRFFGRWMREHIDFGNSLQDQKGRNLIFAEYYPITYGDKILMTVNNFSISGVDEDITVIYQGKTITEYTDLLTGTVYTAGDGLDLGPSDCALLCFNP